MATEKWGLPRAGWGSNSLKYFSLVTEAMFAGWLFIFTGRAEFLMHKHPFSSSGKLSDAPETGIPSTA